MADVTSRIISVLLTLDANGIVGNMKAEIQFEADNPQNPARPVVQRQFIAIGLDDMTPGDKTSATAFAVRITDMIKRKVPTIDL